LFYFSAVVLLTELSNSPLSPANLSDAKFF